MGLLLETGSFTTASRLTGSLGMFLLGAGGYVDLPSSSVANMLIVNEPRSSRPSSLLASGPGNVDTWSREQPQKPQESPREVAGRRVRWSLGMHSEESVTYLLAELSEPCLSQPLPPQPVCPTSSSHFPLCFVL